MLINKVVKLKSNKGFTMNDLIAAIAILTIFVGLIGSLLVTTYKIQAISQVDELAMLYVIQAAEYIDKVSFDEVDDQVANKISNKFSIPEAYTLSVYTQEYLPYGETVSYVKNVSITIKYKNFNNEDKNISIDRLKIKEI